ncbi:D-alanyl-D-alanine carboxypeptidase/D-alanyl-D-alanine-endopeptidase [Massilia sp. G4R7]|uniref:D-alanyl-D-alanine carboxypeptidase/D-alanyl-D-alanine-endopeptidase n=1 Tax=Massilia phyllostachyos TaxID=2898585 RepID=A0ABS8Q214_9BURK|nr:D-alanyl-D-alanine carboxypeptidase/D-alanyl-D-alanine-endopeptidase [Massilia phyllostachyos]MCD2515801.1 D-alanyl-D-alanine carboxypeptidase/D-alanyl-D-alanine-endopeptidase [Massilia phyllostachyos]
MLLPLHHVIRGAGALCLAAAWACARAADAVPPPVAQELARQGLPASALAFQVTPLSPELPRHAWQAGRLFNPASAMKQVTTLAALDALGPAYRWTTALYGDGAGNLYLRGGGDPNLDWERLGGMLRELRMKGIATIAGDLVLDRSLFAPARPDVAAPPFDDTPDAAYNVVPDALNVSDYLVTYTLSSNTTAVAVRTTPPLDGVTVVNRLIPNDTPCTGWQAGWRRPRVERDAGGAVRIVLEGGFPRDCTASIDLATLERDLYLERLVRALWRELGGQWSGRVREDRTPAGAALLAARQFETLGETIRTVNKRSDGVKARLVYLTLGATANDAPGVPTLEGARRRVLDWVAVQGVDPAGIVIENGSGLSRIERISPAQLSALLRAAVASPWYPEFAASLPVAGLDGTMRKRLEDLPAPSGARLKTGTLRDAAALSGYVRDRAGRDWIVAAFVNDPRLEDGRSVLDSLIRWVAAGGAGEP